MPNYRDAKKAKASAPSISDITSRAASRKSAVKDDSVHQVISAGVELFYANGNIRDVTEEMIEERRESMEADGQFSPIEVHPKDETGRYLIHEGITRWLAAQRIPGFQLRAEVNPDLPHLDSIDVLIRRVNSNDIHNKNDLLSLAKVYSQLIEKGLTQVDIAKRFHKTRDQVSKILKIMQLPEEDAINLTNAGLIKPGSYRLVYELVRLYEESPRHYSNVVRVGLEQGELSQEAVALQRKKLLLPVEDRSEQELRSKDGESQNADQSSAPAKKKEPKKPGSAKAAAPIFLVRDSEGREGRLVTDRVATGGKLIALIDGVESDYEAGELILLGAR